jgi:hypothetical protein
MNRKIVITGPTTNDILLNFFSFLKFFGWGAGVREGVNNKVQAKLCLVF